MSFSFYGWKVSHRKEFIWHRHFVMCDLWVCANRNMFSVTDSIHSLRFLFFDLLTHLFEQFAAHTLFSCSFWFSIVFVHSSGFPFVCISWWVCYLFSPSNYIYTHSLALSEIYLYITASVSICYTAEMYVLFSEHEWSKRVCMCVIVFICRRETHTNERARALTRKWN